MAEEKWTAGDGAGLTWADAITSANLNSLGSGNALLADVTIANGSPLDMFADVSVRLASLTTPAGSTPFFGIYLYPLLDDGSTYGDGRFGSAAAGPPPAAYFAGSVQAITNAVQSPVGMVRGIVIPPGSFKFVFHNALAVVLASSGNVVKYRTYNRAVV